MQKLHEKSAVSLAAGFAFFLILPFVIMQIVNRRNFQEEFPVMLFFVLWLNLFALTTILLPILWAKRRGTRRSTQLTSPTSSLMASVALMLPIVVVSYLGFIRWESLEQLFNGPDRTQFYLPGQLIMLGLFAFPIAAGVIASRSIANTLRSGGGIFAHPIHLIIVVVISFLFTSGVITLIIDQWPCFMGVPNCD